MNKFLMLVVLPVSIYAQGNALTDSTLQHKKRLHHFSGFSIGYTSAELSGTEIDLQLNRSGSYQKSKTGFCISFDYKLELLSFLYLKSGMGIITKKSEMRKSGFVYPLKPDLQFFTVPLIAGFQPINTRNSQVVNVSVEAGWSANFGGGSNGNTRGLHLDNEVHMRSFVPAFILGGNLEIKVSEKLMIFVNYRQSKDLEDFHNRVYEWYDVDTRQHVYRHYNYRITSRHTTFGLLFTVKRKGE